MLAQAFEPFFTTKADGQGTGLGLSMVFGFVKQSGGHIEMSSFEGQGTRVELYFPRCLRGLSVESAVHDAQHPGGHETVLVVEDNEAVRAAAVELLHEEGYKVLIAANGDIAMQMLLEGVAVDLIFTDVVMPGLIRARTWPPGPRSRNRRLRCCSRRGIPATSFRAITSSVPIPIC